MRTVRTKVLKFAELSETSKSVAIEYERELSDNSYLWDEAHETVKAFNNVFNLNEGRNSWLEYSTNFDDNVSELTGLRLRTYIINNFGAQLYNGKYYSLWSKTDVTFKHHKDGYPVLKSRHSKVFFDNSCVLTGVCYDDSILHTIYEIIEKYSEAKHGNTTIDELFDDCFAELKKDIESEEEARNGDDYLIEQIEANEREFYANGKPYNNQ
jgi:hypothetical protein